MTPLQHEAQWHFREVSASHQAELVATGLKARDFFPHRLVYLPKCGPDGYKLATRMCQGVRLDQLWELVLYAAPEQLVDLPADLWFDRDLVWHQQHHGLAGQVASANLVLQQDRLYSMVHLSDLVQRVGRRREVRSRVENRFHGWDLLLLNAILAFAAERGAATVLTPTAALARRHTDPARSPHPEMFDRVYDRHLLRRFRAGRDGDWWAIDVQANLDRLVRPARASLPSPGARIICVCHDIERGMGHLDVAPDFARLVDGAAPAHLQAMLAVERAAGVRATYSVVGVLLPEVRAAIEEGGHALAFHSFDHTVEGPGAGEQLARCRAVDYRLRGYRAPRSRLTPELRDENLCFHNFEWLASSAHAFGFQEPALQGRLVKIPILTDDFAMHQAGLAYEAWEERTLAAVDGAPFAAISLHDCYANHWLPRYPRLLEALRARGTLKTLDEVADEVTLRHAAP